jgi:hypothetical protein
MPNIRIDRSDGASGIRAVVLVEGESDPARLETLKEVGFNTVVSCGGPDLDTARAMETADVSYLAYISSADVERLSQDADYREKVAAAAAVSSFLGFYFSDETSVEGYMAPEVQRRTYETLKSLFPARLALFPLRLDLVLADTEFLDTYFRPEFSDLVTPYFYAVGMTSLGTFQYADDWAPLLAELLSRLRRRMPSGKRILPVLQGMEQVGYPVEWDFARRQMDVYRALWPSNQNLAAFAWGFEVSSDTIFLSLDQQTTLKSGFRTLLRESAPPDPLVFRQP